MNDNLSYISVTCHYNTLGRIERYEYSWEGKSPLCMITRDLIDSSDMIQRLQKNVLRIGPYRLWIIEERLEIRGLICVRMNYPFWWVVLAYYRFGGWLELFYRRMIITLAVWRLAEYNSMTIPSYRDIYLWRSLRFWFYYILSKGKDKTK